MWLKHHPGCVSEDISETNTWIIRLRKADCPPQWGWPHAIYWRTEEREHEGRSSRRGSVVNKPNQDPWGRGVRSLASLSGLRSRRCRELWCRSQTWLRSHIAVPVAYAGSYSSNLTPSLATSICHEYNPKKTRKKSWEQVEENSLCQAVVKLEHLYSPALWLSPRMQLTPETSSQSFRFRLELYSSFQGSPAHQLQSPGLCSLPNYKC